MAIAPLGQRSPLDQALIDRFVTALASGVFLKDAAAHVGVSSTTAHRWRQHADDPEPQREHFLREGDFIQSHAHWLLCRQFRDAVEKAEADTKLASLGRIRAAGQSGTWQADAWYLERKYPHEFGRRVAELSGPDGGPIEVHDARDRLGAMLDRLADVDEIEATVEIEVHTNGNGAHP